MLIRITAPHYVAGIIVSKNDIIINAAPILKWTIGKRWGKVAAYFDRKGFHYKIVSPISLVGRAGGL